MNNPTCPQWDCVVGCQANPVACPNLVELHQIKNEARRYCDDDSEPDPLVLLSAIAQPTIKESLTVQAIAQPASPVQAQPVAWCNGDALLSFKCGNELPLKLSETKDGFYKTPIYAQPEQTAPHGTDAQILKEREITTSAIVGAMAYGFQNGEYPPDDSAWLRPFWTIGRRDAEREAAIAQPEQQASKSVNGWSEINTLDLSDELVWLRCGGSIDGPLVADTDSYDSYTHWAPVKPPPINIAQPKAKL